MSNKKRIDISVIGYEPELFEFLRLLQKIEYLGIVGASRSITVSVDGDGSGRLNFYFIENGKFTELPMLKFDTNKPIEVSIGE